MATYSTIAPRQIMSHYDRQSYAIFWISPIWGWFHRCDL